MTDIDNNKLIGLLIIAGGGLLLSQEHIKERRKRRQWVRPWIRKRDSKGAYYSIINDLKLTDKEDFRKYLRMNTSTFQVILQVAHCLSKSSLQFMLVSLFTSWNSENKRTYSAQERLYYDLLKKTISV